MSTVVICSLVRNGMGYLPAFRRQIESLQLDPGVAWRLCIVEGDSSDESQSFLEKWQAEDSRVLTAQLHVGRAREIEDRAGRWARVGNACFDLAVRSGDYTHVLWIESDLCFPPELLRRLLAQEVDIVAPMIYLGGLFYDTWGFRDLTGTRWTNEAPYHQRYRGMDLIEMGSVGSCVLFRRAVLDAGIRFKGTYEHGLLVGMCEDARAAGFRVWADTSTAILHPVDYWEAQLWRVRELVVIDRVGRSSTLSPRDLRALRVDRNVPSLDPGVLLRTYTRLWRDLYRRLETNRLEVQVRLEAEPGHSYSMTVRACEPSGLARLKPVRKLLLGILGRSDYHEGVVSGLRASGGKLSFRCEVSIAPE